VKLVVMILAVFVLGASLCGLEPAYARGAGENSVINATNGDDVIVVEDAGGGSTTITINGSGTTITNPTALLTINGLAGNDTITIVSLAGLQSGTGFGASFVFDGGPDMDSASTGSDLLIADDTGDDDVAPDEFFRLLQTESIDVGHTIVAGPEIRLDGDVMISGMPTVLSAESVSVTGSLDGLGAGVLNVVGDLSLAENVGSVSPFDSLSVSGETVAGQDVDLIRTRGNQDFDKPLDLANDTTIVSAGVDGVLRNGRLSFAGIKAADRNVVFGSQGTIRFLGGGPQIPRLFDFGRMQLNANSFLMSSNVLLRMDAIEDTVINAPTRIGASARIRIEQQGGGDLVFLDSLTRNSGSPHHIALVNQDGDVEFNGNVAVGQLTIEEGSGAGSVRINASRIETVRAGANNGRMIIDPPITLLNDTTLASRNGELQINGDIDSAGFFITFETSDTSSSLNGQITAEFSKQGPGDFRVTSTGNRIDGVNFVNEGRLLVDGEFLGPASKASPVRAGGFPDGTLVVESEGVLGGNGVLDVLVGVFGTVNPGDGVGVLTIETAEFIEGSLVIDINGEGAGTGFDQLVVTEAISLDDTALEIQGSLLARGRGAGTEFIIVDNQSPSPVTGTFLDLPEGAFVVPGQPLQITYVGGDGNDIALFGDRLFADEFEGPDND